MGGVSQMDSWFYGGITLMGAGVLLAVVSIVIFKIKAPAFRKEVREFFICDKKMYDTRVTYSD